MIIIKRRVVHLLQFLIKQNKCLPTHKIASIFNVNIRTIQQDIADLNDLFKEHKWNASIIRTEGSKVFLKVADKEKIQMTKFVHEQNPLVKVYSPEERRYLILMHLFKKDEPIIIKEMEIEFFVSESTILRDLNHVQKWIEQKGLVLIRKQNYGIQIVGSEILWRLATFDLIKEYLITVNRISLPYLFVHLQYNYPAIDYINNNYFIILDWLLGEEDFYLLNQLIRNILPLENYRVTDDTIASLVIHIAIIIYRNKRRKMIRINDEHLNYISSLSAYRTAEEIFGVLQQKLKEINFSDEEISYLAMHIASSRFMNPVERLYFESKSETEKIVESFVRTLEVFTRLDLRSDQQFMIGLYSHIKPMLERLKFGIPIQNELLREVQEKYPEIYTATKLAVLSVESFLPSLVPEDEIGYLTLHVSAVLERMQSVKHVQKKRVILVCGHGIGTSNLLQIQLAREFAEIVVVGNKNFYEAQYLDPNEVDLIISTIEINHPIIPTICINPILNGPEIDRLRLEINKSGHSSTHWEFVIEEIVQEAKKSGLENPSDFRESIRNIFYQHIYTKPMQGMKKLKEDIRPMLQDLLNENTIQVHKDCKDWEEAVYIAGKILLEEKCIEERYINAMVEVIKNHGPYVVIAPGVALLHARPEDGVSKVCMSLIVCQGGVSFGNEEKDPVHLVFAFGAVDNTMHLRALSQMMTLLNDEEAILNLKNALSVEDAVSTLSKSIGIS
ncbi:BglG family transcription antiterminator [Bacillus sp. FJAT-49732]|uniref:BglG family transcription antiterminator n=1 Tax=Lederbergia citrisecunda TaxID=2833583 RepID=A0A942TSJ4_9BACI|nr:BglG family transcription antiterminator [Lederbergia citrisecunda]